LIVAGFSPVISVAGANFPVWTICLIAGIAAALTLRQWFARAGIDEWMQPALVVYSSLALVVASICWLLAGR